MAAAARIGNLALNLRLLSLSTVKYNGVRCITSVSQRVPLQTREDLRQPSLPLLQTTRSASFFNRKPAEQLWKGVTSVSSAGRKKGRGKGMGKKVTKDLNRGQFIGVGSENMVWPGLNAPILRGRELVKQASLPKDEEREANLIKLRDSLGKFRRLAIDPLERGWSGNRLGGRSIGPPDAVGEDTFEGFDTHVLDFKVVSTMTAVFGRKRQFSLFVVTGNGNGLAGFSLAKGTTMPAVIRKAKNKAAQNLLYIPLFNEHTVLHNFYSQFGKTKLFVSQKPEGYGLVCHRAIKTVCQAIGIKDMHARIEGSKCVQNAIKAFFMGLLQQKTHQQLSDEKGLHLVELRGENLYYPKVMASPSTGTVRTMDQIAYNEDLDVTKHVMGGRLALKRKQHPPGYERLPSYQIYLKRYAKTRNRDKVQTHMLVHDGWYKSFLAEKYPECQATLPGPWKGKNSDM